MYRTTLRLASRPVANSVRSTALRSPAPRRFASTATPANKPRSLRSSALRWGLAVAAVYYYNTSPVFAEEIAPQTVPAPSAFPQDDYPTVDALIEEKRKQIQSKLDNKEATPAKSDVQTSESAPIGSPAALEEEAGQQGAFNPETGEINWDCPCLGGMADGPCGEEFKTAFSCFVYSEEEPKGMDCIDKFQGMQECFKKYPEIYGSELADDEDAPEDATVDVAGEPPAPVAESQKESDEPVLSEAKQDKPITHQLPEAKPLVDPIPKQWDDATEANQETQEEEEGEKREKKEKKQN